MLLREEGVTEGGFSTGGICYWGRPQIEHSHRVLALPHALALPHLALLASPRLAIACSRLSVRIARPA